MPSEGGETMATEWLESVLWWPVRNQGRPWLYTLVALVACTVFLTVANLVPLSTQQRTSACPICAPSSGATGTTA